MRRYRPTWQWCGIPACLICSRAWQAAASMFRIAWARAREGTGTLTDFTTWSASSSTWLDTALDNAGAAGKHGDRDAVWHGGQLYDVVEGTTNPVYSSADWRLYSYGFTENAAVQIPVRTAGGSTAFANCTVTSLTGPGGIRDLVISIFIFSKGAAPGKAANCCIPCRTISARKRAF